jgi:hypothetical protein
MAKKEKVDPSTLSDQEFCALLNDRYGRGEKVFGFATDLEYMDVARLSSGSLGFDIGLYGGWPAGRVLAKH